MDSFDSSLPQPCIPITYCRHCRYWDATFAEQPTKTPEGLCRRHAPHPAIIDDNIDNGTNWPRTFEDDWCGEGTPIESL